jgi:hypothetical protein
VLGYDQELDTDASRSNVVLRSQHAQAVKLMGRYVSTNLQV